LSAKAPRIADNIAAAGTTAPESRRNASNELPSLLLSSVAICRG